MVPPRGKWRNREWKRLYQRSWKARRRAEWITAQGAHCKNCGSTDELEVDHIDPALKTVNPTDIWSMSQHRREAELANCQVLCKDCNLEKRDLYLALAEVPF